MFDLKFSALSFTNTDCTELPDGSVAALFVDSVLLVTLLVVVICLVLIRRKIWKIERSVLRGHAMAKSVHDDRDTAKKVAGYLSIFILKWVRISWTYAMPESTL